MRSELGKYCLSLQNLIGEGCNFMVMFILVVKF